jgi:hypothetical protein
MNEQILRVAEEICLRVFGVIWDNAPNSVQEDCKTAAEAAIDVLQNNLITWHPIETAPNTEEEIMVSVPCEVEHVWRPLYIRGDDVQHRKNYWWMEHATHWAPCMKQPKIKPPKY